MNFRHGLLTVLACCAAALLADGAAAERPARPNIIFILADDLGPGDLGCYGGAIVPTPRIDQLAAEGTRFTQYYSASPICSPSRAGIITGMHPAQWRITSYLQTRKGNAGCEQADFLDPGAPSLPRALKAAGYATAHFGKWHLGGGRDVVDPPKFAAYGYDEHASTWESPEPHPDITATNWIWSEEDKVKRWERTTFFVDQTLSFLDRHRAQPCFVNLWLDDPHTPWVPDAASDKKSTRKNLRGVLAEIDKQVGRLLDGLKQKGLEENSIVIFTSDNGPLPTLNGARSAGFRGSKMTLYEGGIRMPFILRWPGAVPAGRVDQDTVFTALDLFPTFCGLTGATLPRDAQLDGIDVSAAWRAETVPGPRPLYWEYGRNDLFFKYPEKDRSPNLAVRRGPWKLLVSADGTGAELYDLSHDNTETKNLAGSEPALVRELTGLVQEWRSTWPKRK
jgi:arylsulfatase A-like enzyme